MPSTPSIVLGISFGHGDSSAALIVDGQLVAAAEEERFTRIKHDASYPTRSVEYCLKSAGVEPNAVRALAVAKRPLSAWTKKLLLAWENPQLVFGNDKNRGDSVAPLNKWLGQTELRSAKIFRVEHHLAHLASARLLSSEEHMALFSFDGLGDFVSATMARAKGPEIEILERVHFPHSLGFFYTAMTQYLGFPHFGDEFKVMGLSSFGEPKYLSVMRQLVREKEGFNFELNLEAFPILREPMRFYIKDRQPRVEPFYHRNALTRLLGFPPRKPNEPLTRVHWDLAKSIQARFEEIANHLLKAVHRVTAAPTIGLAGGCAHNSVWVGKIPANSPFTNVLVAPASHDAGIAVGAAAVVSRARVSVGNNHPALLGPDVHATVDRAITAEPKKNFEEVQFRNDEELIHWMVNQLTQRKIIGLCRGRMEFGPRALGSRSIIADPRWPDMKDRLNERVKHRETFRPFAASVLAEHQNEWFADCFHSPTMEAVFDVKQAKRARIPAVVHVDNTCRIQSVTRDTQPFYWDLIEAFRQKTGVPMIVNTSFNDSEPIVCTAEDAWRCFMNTDLDHLVVGNRAFSKVAEALSLTA